MHIYYPDLEAVETGEIVQLCIDLCISVEDSVMVRDFVFVMRFSQPIVFPLRLIQGVRESRTIEVLQCIIQEAGSLVTLHRLFQRGKYMCVVSVYLFSRIAVGSSSFAAGLYGN